MVIAQVPHAAEPRVRLRVVSTRFLVGLAGIPGSGKDTCGLPVAAHFGAETIQTGHLCRLAASYDDGDEARQLRKILNPDQLNRLRTTEEAHSLAPSDVIEAMIRFRIARSSNRMVLFIGYPRTPDQGQFLGKFSDRGRLLVHLELSEREAFNRLRNRRICYACSTPYSIENCPTVCSCGGEIGPRRDDNWRAFQRRMRQELPALRATIETFPGEVLTVSADQPENAVREAIIERLSAYFT